MLTYTVSNVSDPSNVLTSDTATVNANGTVTLNYKSVARGMVTLTVTATNLAGQSTTQTFTVNVNTTATTTSPTSVTTSFDARRNGDPDGQCFADERRWHRQRRHLHVHGTGIGSVTTGTVANGQASTTINVPAGTAPESVTITAAYNGGGGFASSTNATGTFTITTASTTISTPPMASAVPNDSLAQSITLSATVTSVNGSPVNGGTFTFTVGSLGTVTSGTVTNGTASAIFPLPANTPAQTLSITTNYSGSADFAATSNTSGSLVRGRGDHPQFSRPAGGCHQHHDRGSRVRQQYRQRQRELRQRGDGQRCGCDEHQLDGERQRPRKRACGHGPEGQRHG